MLQYPHSLYNKLQDSADLPATKILRKYYVTQLSTQNSSKNFPIQREMSLTGMINTIWSIVWGTSKIRSNQRLHNNYYCYTCKSMDGFGTHLWTNPSSRLCSTWALYLISFTSCGVLSEHCPLVIGLSNMLLNSVFEPRKLGRTKSTIHQYSVRLFCSG